MISVYNSKDHRWKDSYNPLRGLTMCRLVGMLEAGERGQFADLQWLYYFMERSDAVIASVVQRRRAALLSVDWDIRLVAGRDEGGNLKAEVGTEDREISTTKAAKYAKGKAFDPVLAEEQKELLRYAYDQIENFKDAVGRRLLCHHPVFSTSRPLIYL